MFTHRGNKRTAQHNLQIASVLSFVAGVVNVVGFIAVAKLTTNVTGHFAFFIDEVFKLNWWQGLSYFLYILCFFMGSFMSSFMVEIISRKNQHFIYIIPTTIECLILGAIAIWGHVLIEENLDYIAYSLLFAMGLQNSLVTRISNATVRTTHLTGLFTDLGIEISQLFFHHQPEEKTHLRSSIKLRLIIIFFFFLGGVIGGVFYSQLGLHVLFIGVFALVIGLIYDNILLTIKQIQRKMHY